MFISNLLSFDCTRFTAKGNQRTYFSITGIISAWQICRNCCLLVNCGKLPLKANCTLWKAYDRYIIKSSKKPQFLDIFFVRGFEYINSVKSTGQALDATFS